MPPLSTLKTAIFFETQLGDSLYSIRYTWAEKGQIRITLRWKDKFAPQTEGLIRLEDLRKIVDTFEALHQGSSPSSIPFVEVPS